MIPSISVIKGVKVISSRSGYILNNVIKKIETVDGVGNVRIGGEKERTKIRLNKDRVI